MIGKHVRNVFKEGELHRKSVWAKFAYTVADGKVYDVDDYNSFTRAMKSVNAVDIIELVKPFENNVNRQECRRTHI